VKIYKIVRKKGDHSADTVVVIVTNTNT